MFPSFNQAVDNAMKPVTGASDQVSNALSTAKAAVQSGATALGSMTSAVTSFLGPLPAVLWIFPSAKVPVGIPMPIQFKPEKLTFSKKAEWEKIKVPESEAPEARYAGAEPERLQLDLFFDTTETQLDVRLHTTPLRLLITKKPILDQPPLVRFQWGTVLSKKSYVESVEVEYQMFRADGTPLRAQVKLSLVEWNDKLLGRLQNPTSYSDVRKTWVVVEGQTLDWIAYQEYGDPAYWRHIAEVNDLDDPLAIRPGQILKLTPLP